MHVKTLCLGALCLGDATGYDIKKLFESAFNHFHHASFGSIYPALKQLEAEGLVTQRTERGTRHPDRKLFHATVAGRDAFTETLAQTPPTEHIRSEFLVLLFFAHLLPTEVLAARLDEAEYTYAEEVAYLEGLIDGDCCPTAGVRLTVELGIATYRAKIEVLRKHRTSLLARHREAPQDIGETPSCTRPSCVD